MLLNFTLKTEINNPIYALWILHTPSKNFFHTKNLEEMLHLHQEVTTLALIKKF